MVVEDVRLDEHLDRMRTKVGHADATNGTWNGLNPMEGGTPEKRVADYKVPRYQSTCPAQKKSVHRQVTFLYILRSIRSLVY